MSQSTEALDCVAFMLIADNAILVEKRSMTKRLLPGALAIPGGHVEEGESIEDALARELHEELDITPQGFFHICTLLHQTEELRRIHYFVVEQWTGEMRALEAESLRWLPLNELAALDLQIDVMAVKSYLIKVLQLPTEYRPSHFIRGLAGVSVSVWLFFAILSLLSYQRPGQDDALYFGSIFFVAGVLCVFWLRTVPKLVRFENDHLLVQDWWWKSRLRYEEIVTVRTTIWGLLIGTAKKKVLLSKVNVWFCTAIYEQLVLRVPVAQADYQRRFAKFPIVIDARRFSAICILLFTLLVFVALPIAMLNHLLTEPELSIANRWGGSIFGVVWLAMGVGFCYGILHRFIWRYTFTATTIKARYTLRSRVWQMSEIRTIRLLARGPSYSGQPFEGWQVEIGFASGEILLVTLGLEMIDDNDVGEELLLSQLAERLHLLYGLPFSSISSVESHLF